MLVIGMSDLKIQQVIFFVFLAVLFPCLYVRDSVSTFGTIVWSEAIVKLV